MKKTKSGNNQQKIKIGFYTEKRTTEEAGLFLIPYFFNIETL
jgi:hypothetical protein